MVCGVLEGLNARAETLAFGHEAQHLELRQYPFDGRNHPHQQHILAAGGCAFNDAFDGQ